MTPDEEAAVRRQLAERDAEIAQLAQERNTLRIVSDRHRDQIAQLRSRLNEIADLVPVVMTVNQPTEQQQQRIAQLLSEAARSPQRAIILDAEDDRGLDLILTPDFLEAYIRQLAVRLIDGRATIERMRRAEEQRGGELVIVESYDVVATLQGGGIEKGDEHPNEHRRLIRAAIVLLEHAFGIRADGLGAQPIAQRAEAVGIPLAQGAWE